MQSYNPSKSPENNFRGPLFIVGLPRSGTKLIRDILNRNPTIAIPIQESHFIPYFIDKFGTNYDFKPDRNLYEFYKEFTKTTFYIEMKEKGYLLQWNNFSENAIRTNWATIIEFIFRTYVPKTCNENLIWGDKTPGYINHISLLIKIFPWAKFIHIIRDPRDYCLSIRKTWDKNVYRAADRWKQAIEKIQNNQLQLSINYYEIKYEDLLTDTDNQLKEICSFLSCDYSKDMKRLKSPSENLGDTKGAKIIVSSNINKYNNEFSNKTIRRIEEIVYPILIKLNYPLNNEVKYKPLSKWKKTLFKLQDSVAILMFYLKNEGNIKNLINSYRKSSWR